MANPRFENVSPAAPHNYLCKARGLARRFARSANAAAAKRYTPSSTVLVPLRYRPFTRNVPTAVPKWECRTRANAVNLERHDKRKLVLKPLSKRG
eukprot:scaffold1237_cov243-Pinguiococcus_pyrenoidosus.AAC.37